MAVPKTIAKDAMPEMYKKLAEARGKSEEEMLKFLGLWEACLRATHRQVRNNGPLCLLRRARRRPPSAPLNIVREPIYLPVRDHAPAGDEVWSQVPDYGYWAD